MFSEDDFPHTGVEMVGLSDPQLSQGRRRMLDLVNRLHSTGLIISYFIVFIAHRLFAVSRSTSTFLKLLSSANRALGSRLLLKQFLGLHCLGPQEPVPGMTSSFFTCLVCKITCTTYYSCPTECRLLCSQSPWQCVVALRFITDSKGQPLGQARNEQFGPIIYDKSEVEERIRQAQRAILNPSKPYKVFLEGKQESQHSAELSFSNNCVSLQISGPDIADLSFCDLPGAVFLFLFDFGGLC